MLLQRHALNRAKRYNDAVVRTAGPMTGGSSKSSRVSRTERKPELVTFKIATKKDATGAEMLGIRR